MKRTHNCGELRIENVNTEVVLCGWVNKRRNFGALVFIDLRDREGLTQCVFDESISEQIVNVRNEYILEVHGTVVERKDKNPKMPTGDIETKVNKVQIRYLDLRRETLQSNLKLRHNVTMITRNYLSDLGFLEIETPILCKSTPEGARDYLVPSRITKGSFYALPQSPQIYKQLLMIGGMDKYFQIARCFRDEDLRADRQPEFTQIDIEMSFVEEEDVFQVVEGLMKVIFTKIKNIDLTAFKRMTYNDAMRYYGSDKPDLRFDMKLSDISDVFADTSFEVFKNVLNAHGMINCIVVKNAADKFSRKDCDHLTEFVKVYGAKALAYLKYCDNNWNGSVNKVVSEKEKEVLVEKLSLENNDMIFMIADKAKVVQSALGALRVKLGKDLHLIDENKFEFLWVTDFPMFEYVEEEDRYVAAHHPFTSPNLEDVDKLMSDPANCYSRAYDLVLNGYELLSGSIRIHDQKIQEKVFEAIGLTPDQAHEKFGFFLEAFKYGTPPHGGVGIGLERLVMILAGTDNIKDVVAFPKTASATDLMSEAPSRVDENQLKELAISVKDSFS